MFNTLEELMTDIDNLGIDFTNTSGAMLVNAYIAKYYAVTPEDFKISTNGNDVRITIYDYTKFTTPIYRFKKKLENNNVIKVDTFDEKEAELALSKGFKFKFVATEKISGSAMSISSETKEIVIYYKEN